MTPEELTLEIAHLRELLEMRDRAREIQAIEYARRLDELNHAHREAVENWHRSLPREVFDTFERTTMQWREQATADSIRIRTETEERSDNLRQDTLRRQAASQRNLALATSIVVALMALMGTYLSYNSSRIAKLDEAIVGLQRATSVQDNRLDAIDKRLDSHEAADRRDQRHL